MSKRLVKISKFLSLILRHKPETVGVQLDAEGWIDVDMLLDACAKAGRPIERQELLEVVATSNKKRFALQNGRIRANQGHSLAVDLRLKVKEPPEHLYHGTARRFLESIRDSGLMKMARHHVHLSADIETALKVGQRHGRAVVLVVAALKMQSDGYQFYLSENGVWLVDSVPWRYLEQMSEADRSNPM